jgi:hypothetical protein
MKEYRIIKIASINDIISWSNGSITSFEPYTYSEWGIDRVVPIEGTGWLIVTIYRETPIKGHAPIIKPTDELSIRY